MDSRMKQTVWVAVRVQRGFVAEVRGFADEVSARRRERYWRCRMNPDYDDTGISSILVEPLAPPSARRRCQKKRR